MSSPPTTPDELRKRLLQELARGSEANLKPILDELDLRAEPSAHVDATILAAVPDTAGSQGPPIRIDRAVLAASEAAVAVDRRGTVIPFRKRNRAIMFAGGGALALAACLALVLGLHGSNPPGEPATAEG